MSNVWGKFMFFFDRSKLLRQIIDCGNSGKQPARTIIFKIRKGIFNFRMFIIKRQPLLINNILLPKVI